MKIGALAEATATSIETIRFYEREGLLPPPARAENNYRVYLPAHVERLAFIRQCRHLDMTLDEIRALIALRQAPAQDCTEVNALLDAHIGHVAQRIRELRALEQDLLALRARTHEGTTALSAFGQSVGYLLASIGPVGFGFLHDISGGSTVPLIAMICTLAPMLIGGLVVVRDWKIEDDLPARAAR